MREGVEAMDVHFTPDVQAKLDQMAQESGRRSEELVEEAVLGYFDELDCAREMLDQRYDDLESGKVKPIDGEAFFESLRSREDQLLKKPALR
jgi:predicted transcriptional regulator